MYEQLESGVIVPASPKETEYNMDSWANNLSGMGIAGMDKTESTVFNPYGNKLAQQQLEAMYRYDWLSRKICERPAKDATRKFIRLAKENPAIEKKLKKLKLRQKIKKAVAWGRLFGGAGVVLITKGDDPEDELDPSKVTDIIELEVFDRYSLMPVLYDTDPESCMYQQPILYQNRFGARFHRSRVSKFIGAELTYEGTLNENYWGGSLVEAYWDAIRNLQATMQDLRAIMSELNLGILKVPGLTAGNAMGDQSPAMVNQQRRLNAFNAGKSVHRAAAIDSKEDFQFVNRSVTGVADISDRFMTSVSAATDFMPELVLFGKTPAGLNATSEEQLQVYYDGISDIQQDQIAPCVDLVLSCLADDVEWEFETLWEMSDVQKADVMQKTSQAIAAIADVTGLTPEEARMQLNQYSAWDLEESDSDAPNMVDDE